MFPKQLILPKLNFWVLWDYLCLSKYYWFKENTRNNFRRWKLFIHDTYRLRYCMLNILKQFFWHLEKILQSIFFWNCIFHFFKEPQTKTLKCSPTETLRSCFFYPSFWGAACSLFPGYLTQLKVSRVHTEVKENKDYILKSWLLQTALAAWSVWLAPLVIFLKEILWIPCRINLHV